MPPQHFARTLSAHRTVQPWLYGVRVRYRALALPLALTGGDYLLWNWSLASGHDIVALVAGLTLLPLVALSGGLVGVAALSLVARLARRSSTMARSMRVSPKTKTKPATADRARMQPAERSSRDRLAA